MGAGSPGRRRANGSLLDLDWDFVSECIGSPSLTRGEGPLVFKDNLENKWHLFIDEYGGRGYVPFESTDLDAGKWNDVIELVGGDTPIAQAVAALP